MALHLRLLPCHRKGDLARRVLARSSQGGMRKTSATTRHAVPDTLLYEERKCIDECLALTLLRRLLAALCRLRHSYAGELPRMGRAEALVSHLRTGMAGRSR